jgi:hypothetical protein
MACSRLALPRWSLLAKEADAMRLDALAMQVLGTRHATPSLSPHPSPCPNPHLNPDPDPNP